jgi:hypothetical protein
MKSPRSVELDRRALGRPDVQRSVTDRNRACSAVGALGVQFAASAAGHVLSYKSDTLVTPHATSGHGSGSRQGAGSQAHMHHCTVASALLGSSSLVGLRKRKEFSKRQRLGKKER